MKTFVLFCVFAVAIASPVEKSPLAPSTTLNVPAKSSAVPDISTLPLQKDAPKPDHKLHKRETPQVAAHSPAVSQSNVLKSPAAIPSNVPLNNNQQSPVTNTNSQRRPITSNVQSPSANNAQRTSQLNQRRPSTVNVPSTSNVNAQRTNQAIPSNNNLPKTGQVNPSVHNNQQVNPSAPRPLTQGSQPLLPSPSRVRRDAPKAVAPSAPVTQGQKSPATNEPSVNVQKVNSAPLAKSPTQTQASRKTRDSDHKAAPALTKTPVDNKATPLASSNLPRVPLTSTQAKTQPQAHKIVTRDAPNPYQQSKIVPGAHAPAQPSPALELTQLKPSPIAKTGPVPSISHPKRETPASNLRDSSSFSSPSNNQSPVYHHPVPVDQILKKGPPSDVTITKTDSVKIEPALPTTEVKKTAVKTVTTDTKTVQTHDNTKHTSV